MVSSPSLRLTRKPCGPCAVLGCSDESIREILRELPDPFDLQRDWEILAPYGVSQELLTDRMGGSP